MRILVTGGNGQLGSELQRIVRTGEAELGPLPAVYAHADVVSTDVQTLDITDADAVSSFVSEGGFDVIINCAAMTNVDGCEAAEDDAWRVNAEAPGNLACAAEASGATFVQVSTDYVFPGTEPRPRLESDPTGPVSVYGRTKLAGERKALEGCSRCFVVRTAWLYGYVGKNFVKTMMRIGKTHDEVAVVDDQVGNPTSANDLAYEILRIAATKQYGIYHCTNNGICSWADFAETIMDEAGLACKVVRCTSEEYAAAHPNAARRPAYSALRNAHLEETIGDDMRSWREAFSEYMRNFPDLEG
ncbi:dTDP-4-dehydrorhamnose reductase [Raoultibacter phocaeensis]|uniref:dTDP-4-dehydrorhamnose reductase n=1 Tax=Raoultibacter phocaeensis TaxID=2479841 RepID=UPI00111A3293|nr:dTDP-4-dehydrorhamnose reductase [Raoultibacter phocaeensis]